MQHPEKVVAAAFVVEYRGLKVQCENVDAVVEAVQRLAPLEREVPLPRSAEAPEVLDVPGVSPVATAVYDLYREEAKWRRPVEIVRALKKRRVPGAKYTTVYAVLRYGDFVKREGKWNMKDAPLAG